MEFNVNGIWYDAYIKDDLPRDSIIEDSLGYGSFKPTSLDEIDEIFAAVNDHYGDAYLDALDHASSLAEANEMITRYIGVYYSEEEIQGHHLDHLEILDHGVDQIMVLTV